MSSDNKISISFDYPQFDIDSDEIKEINSEIKKRYVNDYNVNFSREISEFSEFGIEKNGKYYCNSEDNICEFYYITYNISENDQYLAITFNEKLYHHGTGSQSYFGYAIDKTTKKVLTNSELVELFQMDEKKIIDEYNQHIKSLPCTKESKIANTIDDINLYVLDNQLTFEKIDGCA